MSDLVRFTLKDRLWISRLGFAPTLTIPPIELTNGQRGIRVVADAVPVALDNPTTQVEVALAEMFRGPPGDVGTRAVVSLTAAETIPGHRAVMLDADGMATLADPTQRPFILAGVSATAANTGGRVNVIISGLIENDLWSFTPLAPIFVAPDGRLVQVRPTSGVLQIIGAARTPTSLLLSPQSPTVLS
jgi:hypothetical protein